MPDDRSTDVGPDVLDRCARGDRAALHEVYGHTSAQVYGLLLRMTRSADDAFDLTQDTYVRAFTRFDQFDRRSSISTWLCRIAINEAMQFFRREGVERSRRERTAARSDAAAGAGTDMRLDVEDALHALPPLDRAMLILRYQDGLDYRAIADVTQTAAGTVGSRLNRARARIRELLKSGYGGAEEIAAGGHPTHAAGQPDTAAPGRAAASVPRGAEST